MPQTKAIFFDLDETLVENQLSVGAIFGCVYRHFLHEFGTDNSKIFFAEFGLRAKYTWANMFDREPSPERQLIECFEHGIAATCAIPSARQLSLAQEMLEHFLFLIAANVSFQDNAEHVLSDLKSMGYITGIITNGIERVQMSKIAQLNLDDRVDHVIISAQARAHKPLGPPFDLALKRAVVSADTAMMIGDHPLNDVAGGIRAGLTGVYYNPKKHPIDTVFADLDERPDHVIEGLAGVLSLVWP